MKIPHRARKFVGYVRVSTEEQEASGLGLADQESKIRNYCDLYGLELVRIHTDAASGKDLRRPGIQAALEDLEADQADGLIVAKLDRLTRNVRDLGTLIGKYFGRHDLVVVAEQVDTRTAGGRLMLNILVSVAQWEREAIGERTKGALQARRRQGKKTGGDVPYGYDLARDGETLIANKEEQAVIGRAIRLKRIGLGYYTIARKLNERGFRTKKGKLFNQSIVCKILARPNETTLKTVRDSDAGRNITEYKDVDEMFRKIGV